jgi:rubrerythrin
MKDFQSIDDILDFAIDNEQTAVDFYNDLAINSRNEEMKQVFTQFAKEEMGHKAKLLKVKTEGAFTVRSEAVLDLKMSDYLVDIEPKPNMSYEEALVLAMKREKSAFKLYTRLSEKIEDANLKKIFQSLALEESKHKLRFELEYDDYVMREN